jgi:cytochrome P450
MAESGDKSATTSPWPVAVPELDAVFATIVGTEEGRSNPYPGYAQLRNAAPVYKSGLGFTVCTGYDECEQVLRDPHFGKDERDRRQALEERFGSADMFPPEFLDESRERRSMLFLNPPDHTRLRSLVNRAFTPRTVEQLRPKITAFVDGLLDEMPEGEPVDVMRTLAFPLPVAVIGHMLGVPNEDWEHFREVMGRATVLLEPVISPDAIGPAIEAQRELEAYFLDLVAERRARPRDDLVSNLIAVQEGSDKLTELELIGTAILIFGAGFETTTNLIGNGLLALLTHRGELEKLREDPGLLRPAVDELLRFDSPVQFDGRLVLEDTVVSGVAVRRHEEIITILGAANRDPARFSDPDVLDLGRDQGPSLSFAAGIHFCLGAALARAEGQVFFARLLDRYSSIDLATDAPSYRNRITLRGLKELPVVVRSGQRLRAEAAAS